MSKTKKLLSMFLVVALVAGIAISGTLAYLTSTDSDVNVMTLGNVKIAQHEYERVVDENGNFTTIDVDGIESYELKGFTQGKPLYPVVGDVMGGYDPTEVRLGQLGHNSRGGMQVLPVANVQDKFVVVENTGNSDAYVRTIVAFEAGSLETVDELTDVINYSFHFTWKANEDNRFIAEIDGNKYMIVEFVYNGYEDVQHPNGVLTPGDYTYNSLAQVYMYNTADNDDVDAIDGNGNGLYDILVLSQGVQTAGFPDAATALNTGFGEVNAENAALWFAGMGANNYIFDATALYESTLENNSMVLAKDINTSDSDKHYNNNREYAIRDNKEYTIDLNGKTINHDSTYQDGNNTGYTYLYTVAYNGKLTINGEGTIKSANSEGSASIFYAQSTGEIVINGGDFNVDKGIAVWAGNGSKVTINGGSFISTGSSNEELIYSSGGVIDIYGGFFHNTGWENRPVNVANANRGTGFINIYGGTFVNFDPSTGGDDPNNIKVADGYKVISETQTNGDVWYTVVAE